MGVEEGKEETDVLFSHMTETHRPEQQQDLESTEAFIVPYGRAVV